jgi:hypothetical protein
MAVAEQLAVIVGQHADHGRILDQDGIEYPLRRHAVGQIELDCLLSGHLAEGGEEVDFHAPIVPQIRC